MKLFSINFINIIRIILILILFSIISSNKTGVEQNSITEQNKIIIDSIISDIDSVINLRLIFAGDVMSHQRQIKSAFNKSENKYDFTENYTYVSELISSFDLAFVNIESPLVCEPPYTAYPNFRNPSEIVAALKDAGFNVILTANNHSNDAGSKALINTIEVIRKNNLYQTGTFKDQNERDSLYPLIIDKCGFKLAVLNYTYGTNNIKNEPPTITNIIDTAQILHDIEVSKLHEPDLIIAYLHWGEEYELYESEYQKKHAYFFADNGVDLLVGSHPHVIQPVKWIKSAENDSIICAYSLGNFISNQRFENTDGGMMLEVSFSKNIITGKINLEDFYHYLTWVYITKPTPKHPLGRYYVIPVSFYENGMIPELVIPEYSLPMMSEFAHNMRVHLNESSVSKEKQQKE